MMKIRLLVSLIVIMSCTVFLRMGLSKEGDNILIKRDSISFQNSNRKIYFGFQCGVVFSDFIQQHYFESDLDEYILNKYKNDSIRAVSLSDTTKELLVNKSRKLKTSSEIYEQVLVMIPAGFVLGIPITKYLDITLSTLSFWKKQEALVENMTPDTVLKNGGDTINGNINNKTIKFVIQSNLAGLGIKFYFPSGFLSIETGKLIYLSYTHLWNLGKSQIYSDYGISTSGFSSSGVGYEVALGFQIKTWKKIAILGNLAFTHLHYVSNDTWGTVLLQDSQDKMNWEFRGLKFNFQFIYQIAGFKSNRGKNMQE